MEGRKTIALVGAAPSLATARNTTRARLRRTVDHQRSEFLRNCRARLDPEAVGLPGSNRARKGGLRREDVAALSGVSTSWYTWLEQGRDIRVSDDVLERICEALRLSADERTYLFSLVQHRLPRLVHEMPGEVPEDVARMVHGLPIPAVAMNLRCDVLAWNAINSVMYRDYGAVPVAERNLMEILLIKPAQLVPPERLEAMARRLVGRLRVNYSKCAGDPKFEALLRRMCLCSPLFNRLWRDPEFSLQSYGPHEFQHPRFGPLAFEHSSYIPDGHPYIRVVLCTPENAATRAAVDTANAELAAAAPDCQA
jgi:transcriptional regulator with XRE-family HTH domain